MPFYILCSDYWACFIGGYGNAVYDFSYTSIISNKISEYVKFFVHLLIV